MRNAEGGKRKEGGTEGGLGRKEREIGVRPARVGGVWPGRGVCWNGVVHHDQSLVFSTTGGSWTAPIQHAYTCHGPLKPREPPAWA